MASNNVDDGPLREPKPPAPTDPRLPLDARQVFKLHKSWKGIKRCMGDTGVELMIRLFRTDVSIKRIFAKFRDIQGEEALRDDENLEKHGLLVMGVFDDVIDNIENVDYVINTLTNLAHRHRSFDGFHHAFFWNIESPFLDAVRLNLGDRYTDNMDAIYKITIHFILETITRSFSNSL